MKKLNLRPALKTRLSDDIKGLSIFYLVMVLVYIAVLVLFLVTDNDGSGESAMSAFSLAATICLFVSGIATVREHLRLCVQHGVGRTTAFTTEIIASVLVCLMLSAAGEVLLVVFQMITRNMPNMTYSDIFQLMFVGFDSRGMTAVQHIEAIFVNAAMMLGANMIGMFISLVFFRLNKVWTIIVAVGVPVLWVFGLPLGISFVVVDEAIQGFLYKTFMWIVSGPWNLAAAFLIVAAITAVFNWLLIRKAPIKVTKA